MTSVPSSNEFVMSLPLREIVRDSFCFTWTWLSVFRSAIARLPRRLIKSFLLSFFISSSLFSFFFLSFFSTDEIARLRSKNHRPDRKRLPARSRSRRLSRSNRMTRVTNKNASSRPTEQPSAAAFRVLSHHRKEF